MMSKSGIQYQLTWAEYGILIDDLWVKLKQVLSGSDIHIDAVVPILREGAFTGIPLSYRLNTYKILPIQYKYMLNDGGNTLEYIAELPKVHYPMPESPVLLLCDTFPSGGSTKTKAIAEIKKTYPQARFVFASIIQDASIDAQPDVIASAFAVPVNDRWETTHPVYVRAGVTNILYTALPWENPDEELAGANQTEWNYS